MAVVPGPIEFLMGAPKRERDVGSYEAWQTMRTERIPHSYAISSKQVTVEQFRRFDFGNGGLGLWLTDSPEPDCPVIGVLCHVAGQYCNWLSLQNGIPKDQWCYKANGRIREDCEDYLQLTGYRFPTEAEWEYACRVGALTPRYYGRTEELLPEYAWYDDNAQQRTWPVACLKPNDLGLFDMLGNADDFCHDVLYLRPVSPSKQSEPDTKNVGRSADSGGSVAGRSLIERCTCTLVGDVGRLPRSAGAMLVFGRQGLAASSSCSLAAEGGA